MDMITKGWYLSQRQAFAPINFRVAYWWIDECVDQNGVVGYTILFNEAEDPTPRFLGDGAWYATTEEANTAAQDFFANSPVPGIQEFHKEHHG